MSHRLFLVPLAVVLLGTAAVRAEKKAEAKYKSIEPRLFTRNEGVELSPSFSGFLYAALKEELKKSKLFAEVTGENETVDPADAPLSFLLEGNLVEFHKGSVAKAVLIGFGAGQRSLVVQFTLKRRSDGQAVINDEKLKVRADPRWNENFLARFMAGKIVGEVKKSLKK